MPFGPVQAQQLDYGKLENVFGEPVTQSATGKPERLSDTPMVMDVITAEDIQRSGVRDLPTLLNRMPGINIFHGQSGTEELSMGGYVQTFGSRVMVLINGRQVYSDAFGEVFWSSLPVEMDEIRQIEVIRGPQSALYGFDAVDGVINIVTFDPLDDPVNSVRVRVGDDARRDVSAITTQRLTTALGVRLSVADDHAHDGGMVDKSASNTESLNNPERRVAALSAGYALDNGDRVGVEASHSDVHQRSIAQSVYFDADILTDSVKADYTTDTKLGQINATAYFTEVNIPTARAQVMNKFQLDDRTAVANLSDLFKIGTEDSFRVGGEFRHDSLDISNFAGGTLSGDLAAASVMWEHRFSPELSMVNAVRYDHFDLGRSGQAVAGDIYTNADFDRSVQGYSINSAVIQKLGKDDALRLSFARGLELPSLLNYGQLALYAQQYGGLHYYGNPQLQPTEVYDYRLTWDHQIEPIGALGRISLFHSATMSLINSPMIFVNGMPALVYEKGNGLITNGLQAQLDHKVSHGWTWGLNYTFQNLNQHADESTSSDAPLVASAAPAHKVNASLGYAWDKWEADLRGTFTSGFRGITISSGYPPTSTMVEINSYATLAPRLAWHPKDNLTIEISAENLWPYKDTFPQKIPAIYYGSVKVTF